jgi:RNA polymerase sigma-70 factor (ECF subfamily)
VSKDSDFEKFYQQHYGSLFYFALQIVKDEEMCRDIVSSALAKTWERFDEYQLNKLKNYTYTIVHGKCVDYVRREQSKIRYAEFYRRMFDEHESGYSYEETDRQINQIYEMMDQLSDKTRYILEQCYFHNRRYKEVAEELGVSVNTIKKHIMTALKAFRRALRPESDE